MPLFAECVLVDLAEAEAGADFPFKDTWWVDLLDAVFSHWGRKSLSIARAVEKHVPESSATSERP